MASKTLIYLLEAKGHLIEWRMLTEKSNSGCLAFFLRKNPKFEDPQTEGPPALYPYGRRDKFLSDGELRFYKVLKPLVPAGYALVTKVRLGDLFFVRRPHENRGARSRIERKHVDFVICDESTMQPALAIELDDSSHNRKDRIDSDTFVDEVFKAAELPLLPVEVVQTYNVSRLSEQAHSYLSNHS